MSKKKYGHIQERRNKILKSIIALFGCILSLTVVYAALSTTLNISGSASITSSTWDISISNITTKNAATGTATFTEPTITGTTIANYTATFLKPGDSVTLYFQVQNNGSINGEITSITSATPTCASSTNNTSDESLVCDNLNIEFEYTSGTSITVGDIINTKSYYCSNGNSVGYELSNVKLTITLDETLTSVPSSQVTISNLSHNIIYTQSDKSCIYQEACFVAGTKVITKDGYKNIEDIEVGDYVYALDIDTNEKQLKLVERVYKNQTYETYEITTEDETILTTSRHRFYVVDRGWVRAYDLIKGDLLSTLRDVDPKIKGINIVKHETPIDIYNIQVEGLHNYLITDSEYLVHNISFE